MATFVKTADIPIAGARTLPGRYFTSPEIWAAEYERIFLRRWLCLGRANRLPEPGAYFLQQLGGESIIVLRDRQGTVRAFYNVCRHRGAQLCEAPCGTLRETIQCPYHAWTYALDGRLVGAPSSEAIENFRKGDWPLHAIAAVEWEGFLFINLASDPQPFDEAFAPLIGRFDRFNLGALVSLRSIEYDVQANWKLIFQNYSECYHCSPVHPQLVKVTPPTSGENDLMEGPFLGGYMVINDDKDSLTMSGRACGLPVGDLPPEDHKRVYYYSIFPNMLLSLHPDYVMVHHIIPDGPARSHITCQWLFHPDTAASGLDVDDGVAFWDLTNRQDWHACEISQRGVASRAYVPGPYSARESLSVQFDREVLRALGHEAPV